MCTPEFHRQRKVPKWLKPQFLESTPTSISGVFNNNGTDTNSVVSLSTTSSATSGTFSLVVKILGPLAEAWEQLFNASTNTGQGDHEPPKNIASKC